MFTWSKDYATGIQEIDNQHKKLVSIGAKLEDMLNTGDSADYYDYILEILEELKDYSEYHFGYEEKRMEECKYKGLEQHRMEHLYFVKHINKLSMQDIDSHQIGIITQTLNFLAKWLFSHILNEDMKYVSCISGKD
ncbi:MAG: hemerythrin family protein [Thermoclostridium sp.]|nr:hemerythrin family protein [Thermoclostridium sp.]